MLHISAMVTSAKEGWPLPQNISGDSKQAKLQKTLAKEETIEFH